MQLFKNLPKNIPTFYQIKFEKKQVRAARSIVWFALDLEYIKNETSEEKLFYQEVENFINKHSDKIGIKIMIKEDNPVVQEYLSLFKRSHFCVQEKE